MHIPVLFINSNQGQLLPSAHLSYPCISRHTGNFSFMDNLSPCAFSFPSAGGTTDTIWDSSVLKGSWFQFLSPLTPLEHPPADSGHSALHNCSYSLQPQGPDREVLALPTQLTIAVAEGCRDRQLHAIAVTCCAIAESYKAKN